MLTTATLKCDEIKMIGNDGKFITLTIDETQEVKCSSFDLRATNEDINEVTLTDVVYIRDLDEVEKEEHIAQQVNPVMTFEDYLYDLTACNYSRSDRQRKIFRLFDKINESLLDRAICPRSSQRTVMKFEDEILNKLANVNFLLEGAIMFNNMEDVKECFKYYNQIKEDLNDYVTVKQITKGGYHQ